MKKIILLTLILTLTACSSSPVNELSENRAKWNDAEASHYQYSLSIGCFCPFMEDMPLTIEVQNGRTVSIMDKDGNMIAPDDQFAEYYLRYSNMESIFDNLEADLSGEADEVIVTYDPAYGFPSQVSIDFIKEAVDDETSYTINYFQLLK